LFDAKKSQDRYLDAVGAGDTGKASMTIGLPYLSSGQPDLSRSGRERINKVVSKDLLETLKAEKLRIENCPE